MSKLVTMCCRSCKGQCGRCLVFKVGSTNTCREMSMRLISYNPVKSDEPIITTEDEKVFSILGGVSAFSGYTVLYKGNAVKLSPEAPIEKICVLSCGVGTGVPAGLIHYAQALFSQINEAMEFSTAVTV